MSDVGVTYTDRSVRGLEKRLRELYEEAERDIYEKLEDFWDRYEVKEAIHRAELESGEITQNDYDAWVRGQVFQGKQWQAKKEQIQNVLYNTNSIATNMINGQMAGVFAANANYMSYSLEHGAGVNFGFGLYDSATVVNLVKNKPQLLPKWKIHKKKDYTWNAKKLNTRIIQGIIQGEKLEQIGKRLSENLCSQNKSKMMTFARTAMTGAQNAGRQESLSEAKKKGISVLKEWMATLDGHTRDTHRELDGQKVPMDKPFKVDGLEIMFPGDPSAEARLVFNCRCTMVGDVVNYPAEYQRRDNIDGQLIKNMTYREWEKAKLSTHDTATKVMDKAKTEEKTVTRDLLIAMSAGTGHLDGLDFKFKSRGSLERKIIDKSAKKNMTQDEYARQITDALRYTNVSDPDHLTDDYMIITSELESKGYQMIEVSNTLKILDAEYRGINTLVRNPHGYTFELQFHTPQSLEIKEINHKLYEDQRKVDTSGDEKRRLGSEMIQNALSIETPKNINMIVNKTIDSSIKQW